MGSLTVQMICTTAIVSWYECDEGSGAISIRWLYATQGI